MTGILNQLKTVAHSLGRLDVPWALIGGLATSVYGTPRTTRDIDLAIVFETEVHKKELLDILSKDGFFNSQMILHVAPTHTLGVRVMIPPKSSNSVPLDLLYCSSGIEREVTASAIPIEVFPGLFIPVAALHHLLAMKTVSENDGDRIQDRMDIQGLLKVATPLDISLVETALILIDQRGFSRGKDLLKRFRELCSIYRK